MDRDLLRLVLVLCLFGLMFCFSMLINQVYGIMTGLGTIDRMKLRKGERVVSHPIPMRVISPYLLSLTHTPTFL